MTCDVCGGPTQAVHTTCESVRILRNRVQSLETANEKIEQLCTDMQATQTGLLNRIVELETAVKALEGHQGHGR
jgi:hypothetical protein